jgi:hypothetical protein
MIGSWIAKVFKKLGEMKSRACWGCLLEWAKQNQTQIE